MIGKVEVKWGPWDRGDPRHWIEQHAESGKKILVSVRRERDKGPVVIETADGLLLFPSSDLTTIYRCGSQNVPATQHDKSTNLPENLSSRFRR